MNGQRQTAGEGSARRATKSRDLRAGYREGREPGAAQAETVRTARKKKPAKTDMSESTYGRSACTVEGPREERTAMAKSMPTQATSRPGRICH